VTMTPMKTPPPWRRPVPTGWPTKALTARIDP
jgi:hypothetical protein